MGTLITVKDYLLSPWIQFLVIAAIAATILIMMPPTRRGRGRGSGQQGRSEAKAKAAPPKAKASVTSYRPLEDPNDGVNQAYRADRGLIPSDEHQPKYWPVQSSKGHHQK